MLSDLKYALRSLMTTPGFTVVAVLTLAFGIGATTAIFSVVNAVLLQPLALKDSQRVMYVRERWQDLLDGVSVGNFADVRRQNTSFASLSASRITTFTVLAEEEPEPVQGELVTAEYFESAGVRPITGRVFSAEEDKPGNGQVAVISERLWRGRLHADAKIVGQALRINHIPYTVVGVMPKSFDPLLSGSELWIPQAFTHRQLADHDNHFLSVIGRLKVGITLHQAQSELDVIAHRLQQEYPFDDKGRGFNVIPLTTALFGDQQLMLWMTLSAVGFVLLIACANIANLQLVRSRTRQKEMALRAALGAAPRRVMRQLLVENIVLGSAGGIVGVILAYWGASWIGAHGPANVPRLDESRVDAATLAFACAVTLVSSLLFGLVPALRSASTRLSEEFKGGASTSGGSRDRLRSALVVGEMAMALVLMAGAGLLIRSALVVSYVNPGFDTSNLVIGRVGLPDVDYHDPATSRQTFERIVTAVSVLPDVQSAGLVSRAPLAGGNTSNGLVAEGRPIDPASAINARLQIVSPGYFATTRVSLKAGREFTSQDTRDKVLVTIVNETLARTMFPGENPIGKRFACCEPGPKGLTDPVWHQIVGVVADVKAWGLDREIGPEFYLPLAQVPPSAWDWIERTMDVMLRMKSAEVPLRELRATVASVAPGVPIYGVSTVQQNISSTLERSHFDTFLLTTFAATGLLLASIGIYGVLSYTVAQRTREIGIRKALGATDSGVMRQVVSHGMKLASLGLGLGLVCALASTRVLSSLLYNVPATDAFTFVTVSVVLTSVALIASYLPARRAAKVDPLIALRAE